jgi:uncharacterized protein YcgI (DUF1989 family)
VPEHIGEIMVPGGYGGAFLADAGVLITIIDVKGQQALDFVALNAGDMNEVLSGVETRRALRSLYVRVRDILVSSRGTPMLGIVEDSIGVHDYSIPACDPTRYAVDFGCPGHRNCLDNMFGPLQEFALTVASSNTRAFQFLPEQSCGRGRTDGRGRSAQPGRRPNRAPRSHEPCVRGVFLPPGHHPRQWACAD